MSIEKTLKIFQKSVEFMSLKEIFRLIYLNKYFYAHFRNNHVAFHIAIAVVYDFIQQKVSLEDFEKVIYDYTNIEIKSVLDIHNICRFSRNLIQDPCGEYNFKGWKVTNGGNGWSADGIIKYNDRPVSFAASYELCKLSTSVDLPRVGVKRKLIVGSPVCRRFDCGGNASLKVSILDCQGKMRSLERKVTPTFDGGPEPRGPWELLCLSFEVDDNDIRADIEFSGKDDKWWAGNYGPRFGYCYARIIALDTI
jgi:F-box associated region